MFCSVARRNLNRLASAVQLIKCDGLDAVADSSLDIVVSNPPYLSEDELAKSSTELSFEPRHSLVAGENGLAAFRLSPVNRFLSISLKLRRRYARSARRVLTPGGRIVFEHGSSQRRQVADLCEVAGNIG